MEQTFNDFVHDWQVAYRRELLTLDLFREDWLAEAGLSARRAFVLRFYHARGHYDRLLFQLASKLTMPSHKSVVIENILEEFGGPYDSHETLFRRFLESAGFSGDEILAELIEEWHYTPAIRAFNTAHLRYVLTQNDLGAFAFFAAYEALDNVDYPLLERTMRTWFPGGDLKFFRVHSQAAHFDQTRSPLLAAWHRLKSVEPIVEAFDFVAATQLEMWRAITRDLVYRYATY